MAIEILTDMADGMAAEQALSRWSRRSRFAGSKDRAAVRDHVFDALRQWRSAAQAGGSDTPRGVMIGLMRLQGADLETLFDGAGYAPAPLTEEEATPPAPPQDRGVRWDMPDWLLPHLDRSLGPKAEATALALRDRAPVTLRVNTARTTLEQARADLQADGIKTAPNTLADEALTITQGPRKLRGSSVYLDGRVELQDAASQAVVVALPSGGKVLDYCAGGGGKALALAMDPDRRVFAHDIDPRRMSDLPGRADRAGATVTQIDTPDIAQHAPFDLVLCDAPCSGSGAWRRAPEGKWLLTPERLAALATIQDTILDDAVRLTAPGGVIAYATCSVLDTENEARIDAFHARHPGWQTCMTRRFDVSDEGDGFFLSQLKRE